LKIEELKTVPAKPESDQDALLKSVLPKLPPEAANVVNDLSGLVKKKKRDSAAGSSANGVNNGASPTPEASKRKAEEIEDDAEPGEKKARVEEAAE
jgi:hypothetical protein